MGNLAKLNIDVPEDVKRKVKSKCAAQGDTLTNVVRRALAAYASDVPSPEFMEAVKSLEIELRAHSPGISPVDEETQKKIAHQESLELAKRMEFFAKHQERMRKKKV